MSLATRALYSFVRFYQRFLSPFLGGHCRFEPSCSNYALVCLERHGAWRGVRLSVWRILRCQPLCAGGHDPPP
jgi:hypothetical protein